MRGGAAVESPLKMPNPHVYSTSHLVNNETGQTYAPQFPQGTSAPDHADKSRIPPPSASAYSHKPHQAQDGMSQQFPRLHALEERLQSVLLSQMQRTGHEIQTTERRAYLEDLEYQMSSDPNHPYWRGVAGDGYPRSAVL
eukprot:576809-Rhodomonas_salina.1